MEAEGNKEEDDKVLDLRAYNVPYHQEIMERADVQCFTLYVQSEEKPLWVRYCYDQQAST